MQRRKYLAVGVIALSLTAGACGSGNRTTQLSNSNGTAESKGPARIPERPAPPANFPDELNSNTNVRDGEVGSVCWATWEVGRTLAASVTDPQGSRAQSDGAALPGRLSSARAELQRIAADSALRPFVDAFVRDIDATAEKIRGLAPADRVKVARGAFAFDSYPGATAYAGVAKKSPNCKNV